MSLMVSEIYEQPDVIRGLWEKERENITRITEEIKKRNIRFVLLAARGTSDHAAIYGKYLLEIKNHLPVGLADASVYTIYDAQIKMNDVLVIGVSQSGEATDVAECLIRSKANGAFTVSITNNSQSTMAKIADCTICCEAGPEKAVAATKTYTSTLAVFYMLSSILSGDDAVAEKLDALSNDIKRSFSLDDEISVRAERYRYMKSGISISRGFNYATALELSLKLAETSYVPMRGFTAADFLHGPIASIHEGDPCFVIAPAGKIHNAMKESLEKLAGRGAETIVFSSEDTLLANATVPLKLETTVDEDLSPILYIVPGQLFAYHLSLTRGLDPDKLKGLSKVTLTM